jgi:hypothetical protein
MLFNLDSELSSCGRHCRLTCRGLSASLLSVYFLTQAFLYKKNWQSNKNTERERRFYCLIMNILCAFMSQIQNTKYCKKNNLKLRLDYQVFYQILCF